MAFEKMSLVVIEGTLKKVNKTLVKCCESACFHIVPFSSSQQAKGKPEGFKTLHEKNIYTNLLKRTLSIVKKLDISLEQTQKQEVKITSSIDYAEYLKKIEKEMDDIIRKKNELEESLEQYQRALTQIHHLSGLNTSFHNVFALKYFKVRFGRLPNDSYAKLDYYENKNFFFYEFGHEPDYIWGLYLTPKKYVKESDEIFNSLYFERVRLPDYFEGTIRDVSEQIKNKINETQILIQQEKESLSLFTRTNAPKLLDVLHKLKILSESHELRSEVCVANNRFYLAGYVPKKKEKEFVEAVSSVSDVIVRVKPPEYDPTVAPPVQLRNNWLFRPFEMFVKMYDLPAYRGFDPTVFVGLTYMLMYGIMFGDVGQGLVISLVGYILHKWKKLKLGPIIVRIGFSSALFGILYGSVFGSEELIPPIFHREAVYTALGMTKPPESIFEISAFLILGAIAIGVVILLTCMIINIIISLRNRDFENGLFGPNGVTGITVYFSLVLGCVLQFMFGISVFSAPYVLALIVFPLILMFFKEQLSHAFVHLYRNIKGRKEGVNEELDRIAEFYSKSFISRSNGGDEKYSLYELSRLKNFSVRCGTLPVDNYKSLDLYRENDFIFFPLKRNDEIIFGIYLCPKTEKVLVDNAFDVLGFKQLNVTDEQLDKILLNKSDWMETSGEKKEKESIGIFIINGVIELFESMLTYLTNTISFLRVGGFVLSHAGMMLVVRILAETAGSFSPLVWIIGNIFVIVLEGFLVGIQALRLELYEIFSRFYRGGGTPYKPVIMDFKAEE